jgi:hypothetical protein
MVQLAAPKQQDKQCDIISRFLRLHFLGLPSSGEDCLLSSKAVSAAAAVQLLLLVLLH